MMNLPNALAIFRIFLSFFFFFVLVNLGNLCPEIHQTWINYFAMLLFVVASITDFFDGYIARSWNQITKFGAIIDPLADKMLTMAGFIGLLYIGRANPWAIYLILVREFFITGFRVIMVSDNVNVSAGMAGKVKTVFQMLTIVFLIMQWWGGEILLWISVFLTLYSGLLYIIGYVKEMKSRQNVE
ncbi:MAG: CDP-diacylglycerol--glycerol-3-phosphate 3-phosphatidyltransferase [Campylobacteraceae bacterium]|nr:CDP-diacylglycerol--glycerol-3-phosphate 3-phosphatidyltransferase [Campylobacteraceae bacterium]